MTTDTARPLRTLLVDNYDSFTHNLYHLITRVNGIPPVLIKNDEKNWQPSNLKNIDNIVISPGPGNPVNPSDFGLCRDILLAAGIPVLGVCLGHQGLCALYGGRVDLAPEPCHGRLSQVTHGQTGLFAHIPSPFSVVRYHSLAVYDLPKELQATAWSEDGVIMGAAHRSRPLFGVQFHPESVCTEYGLQLFRNFAAITRQWRQHRTPPDAPPPPEHRFPSARLSPPPAPAASGKLAVLYRCLPCHTDTETLFDALFRHNRYAAWLDSSQQQYGSGRFSILCSASGPLGRTVKANVLNQTLELAAAGKTTVIQADFFDWLEKDLAQHHIDIPDTPFEFALGWAGYIGYEMKAASENIPGPPSPFPDACLLFCDRALVMDHNKKEAWLLALAEKSDTAEATRWLEETGKRLADSATAWPAASPLPEKLALDSPLTLRHNKAAYLEKIRQCQEALRQGESYEICLTNMASAATSADPWTAWRMLRRANPAPYGAYLKLDGISILSCSPECFLSLSRDGTIQSKPIKGTRPRSTNPVLDRQQKNELAASKKEQAENLMIVDLVRNDLGRIARPGSVAVSSLFAIESYPTVHQMVSTVTARLKEGVSASQCVRAAFPGGSMTGAPKKRTLEILDRLEGGPRGIYSGTLGYFSLCGSASLSIIIRTLVMSASRLSFGVGGAITVLSDPEAEFEETRVKARAFLSLFDTDFPPSGC
ncbi:MAG: aminodeoxychorismate synthase component I [Alistipes senegalensis]|nr:aminodeoxychorismate synthase component I [Oxalobacter formigenes]MCM1280326.1 aminodeoxychorismate synthase component I [Alistipes senegalensis]